MPGPYQRKYPKELDEAIFVLMWQARASWSDTLQAIRTGEAGLDRAYDIPKQTFNEKLRKLKQERGDPRDYIAPAQTVDAIREIERAALEISNKVVRELQKESRAGKPMNTTDLARMDKAVGIAQRLKSAPLQTAKRHQREGYKAQQRSPVTALGKLVGTAPQEPTNSEANGDSANPSELDNPQSLSIATAIPSPVPVGDS